jgi:hypothetical protein
LKGRKRERALEVAQNVVSRSGDNFAYNILGIRVTNWSA